MRPVITDAMRARVTELHAAGRGRNDIAKELGIAAATVTKIAQELGLDFSRAQTAIAVKARSVDLADMRLRLAEKMTLAADELLDSRDKPYLVYAFGGKENDYNEHTLDRPPVETVRTIVQTAGIAFDKATKFLETSDEGEKDAKSLLRDLGAALGITESTPLDATD